MGFRASGVDRFAWSSSGFFFHFSFLVYTLIQIVTLMVQVLGAALM